MTFDEFIFTKKKPQRFARHLAFCGGRMIFMFLQKVSMQLDYETPLRSIFNNSARLIFLTFTELLFTYLTAYILYPVFFLHKRYLLFGLTTGLLLIIIFLVNGLYLGWLKPDGIADYMYFWISLGAYRLKGPPIVGSLFLALKVLKDWLYKERERVRMESAQIESEKQLLKAQVHPHFLFNTLNNIYSFTLLQSGQAGDMLKKLRAIIQYMLHECTAPWVSLEKELKVLNNYMALESIRYGERLKLSMTIHGDAKNLLVPPLLMIPFVENSFKHGASQMIYSPWIHLAINITKEQLDFRLENGRPDVIAIRKNGIGLANVKNRLSLIYPGKNCLDINIEEKTFAIDLRLGLKPGPDPASFIYHKPHTYAIAEKDLLPDRG